MNEQTPIPREELEVRRTGMIVDCFTYNGEQDLLEIRLNVLDQYVDQFIIVEATETFSGRPKPLYYEAQKDRFKKWHHKIKYHIVSPPYEEGIVVLAHGSPNTEYGKGAAHWITEFCQKESIRGALTGLKDEDIVFIGDVDEIWNPLDPTLVGPPTDWKILLKVCASNPPHIIKLGLKVYSYWLNNRSSEKFWGPIVGQYGAVKDRCLNHLRTTHPTRNNAFLSYDWAGWHFSSMGGYEEVKRKLTDSYAKESYANDAVMNNLEQNLKENKDFLGRDFTYRLDESEWPQYLKENRDKYKHLLK